jgi:uncharacterized protein YecE (DUF72 family)
MTGAREGRIIVGTSGWHYPHWQGPFYPAELRRKDWLPFYAEHLPAVEVNNSFYRLPEASTFRLWDDETPDGFRFAVKAPRTITHLKKLRNAAGSLEPFLDRVQALGAKLGPILFQLPPRWHANPQRLSEFLDILPKEPRYAFEFRDRTWHCPEVYKLLAEHDAVFCIYDLEAFTAPLEVTADLVYLRLHGPGEQAYTGSYTDATLRTWAGRAKRWARREERDVYIFFDNDQNAYAMRNARRLMAHLGMRLTGEDEQEAAEAGGE